MSLLTEEFITKKRDKDDFQRLNLCDLREIARHYGVKTTQRKAQLSSALAAIFAGGAPPPRRGGKTSRAKRKPRAPRTSPATSQQKKGAKTFLTNLTNILQGATPEELARIFPVQKVIGLDTAPMRADNVQFSREPPQRPPPAAAIAPAIIGGTAPGNLRLPTSQASHTSHSPPTPAITSQEETNLKLSNYTSPIGAEIPEELHEFVELYEYFDEVSADFAELLANVESLYPKMQIVEGANIGRDELLNTFLRNAERWYPLQVAKSDDYFYPYKIRSNEEVNDLLKKAADRIQYIDILKKFHEELGAYGNIDKEGDLLFGIRWEEVRRLLENEYGEEEGEELWEEVKKSEILKNTEENKAIYQFLTGTPRKRYSSAGMMLVMAASGGFANIIEGLAYAIAMLTILKPKSETDTDYLNIVLKPMFGTVADLAPKNLSAAMEWEIEHGIEDMVINADQRALNLVSRALFGDDGTNEEVIYHILSIFNSPNVGNMSDKLTTAPAINPQPLLDMDEFNKILDAQPPELSEIYI